ncbi:LPXTG cell wall anchor domain-containing protein [Streptomyces gilvus]|uniref:LPXTG cell wall anchor domain-containing protein n=1 Tax=Streptomyces gilvus TaxID=2920937 RepID=UPI001F0DB36F|nr:LPXTG cell wall anchor domain-containing protein [Streptomyces sp. CME 23]MCH5672992.1 LPXTG cell wall anchor domain-containing protein [Streptomyces sp. CME 23]
MSSARRSLLTATAAGTLLGALWFVPSANASQDTPARTQPSATATTQARVTSARTSETSADSANSGSAQENSAQENTELADTGSIDTTPYVVGGTLFLTLGAGFVVYSVRRERLGF